MYSYFVMGTPVPEGSMKAMPYIKKTTGRMGVNMIHQSNKLLPWRDSISQYILETNPEFKEYMPYPKGTPVMISLTFNILRPKSVSSKKRPEVTVKPDLDKLTRAVIDAMTGIMYDDDCQVIHILAKKQYVDFEKLEGVYIEILLPEELPGQT